MPSALDLYCPQIARLPFLLTKPPFVISLFGATFFVELLALLKRVGCFSFFFFCPQSEACISKELILSSRGRKSPGFHGRNIPGTSSGRPKDKSREAQSTCLCSEHMKAGTLCGSGAQSRLRHNPNTGKPVGQLPTLLEWSP